MTIKYPLVRSSWGKEELQAISEVVASDRYSMGSKVKEFEELFAKTMNTKYAVMVNSGSSANLLIVAALFYRTMGPSLKRGDVVVVPAVSWSTTYFPLSQYGLKMRFVDVDLNTLNYDLSGLEAAMSIHPKPKAIMAVNLLGNPNDYQEIRRIIERTVGDGNCILIEDSCESLMPHNSSPRYHSKVWGLMASYSFFFSHHLSTMEGGMIATDDEELYHILLSLRAHGWTRNLPETNLVSGEKSSDPFEESYKFVLPGYNVRPLEMSGAIGIEQLKRLPRLLQYRRLNHDCFREVMKEFDQHFLTQTGYGNGLKSPSGFAHLDNHYMSSWFGFSIICKPESKITRTMVLKYLDAGGVEYRPIVAGNFTRNPVMKHLEYELPVGGLPNADIVHDNGFFIGNDGSNLGEEIYYALRPALRKCVQENG